MPISLINYTSPKKGLTIEEVINKVKLLNVVGQNMRVFQADSKILPNIGALKTYFPHLVEFIKGVTSSKRTLLGFFDVVNKSTEIGINFTVDLDTNLYSLEGYAHSGDEHLAEELLQDLLDTFENL